MNTLKSILRALRDAVNLTIGLAQFMFRGVNSSKSYLAMIGLFCATKGYSSDFLSYWVSLVRRPYRLTDAKGILGDLSHHDIERINGELNEKGYYVFEQKLPEHLCDALLQYALNEKCRITVGPDGARRKNQPLVQFNREQPEGLLYVFDNEDVINNPDVQGLFADPSLISVAQEYLDCQPVLDFPSFWWSTAASPEACVEAAQLHHFDMDRLKWLKFFIYLTDVDEKNGPHTFVAGSHRSGHIPSPLLSAGYARLTDETVEKFYDKKDIISFTAPRGTIIAEDTRGLHKGAHVQEKDRLILQIQFSNCLFGAAFSPIRFRSLQNPALSDMVPKYPRLYSLFQKNK